ncbi:uncharacterized protein EV154DRAFT_63947 [Mucor mucedo]|uniref:Uncharacterized protein n=1 Tax=Mucor saturninus TaxID=64648 RepID=A0A8H7QVU0_9FUNG|nr:uncharacterized protein EV154DRAFT_63947 [Mucor mucedo]KAG2198511.1 hypothetical protein INT47_008615 [Mucor saturninus]KAI7876807.1 hypothetical protein EV154DRAFT_63947 [Mucor mucedo]
MTNLSVKLKLANTFATLLLVGSQGFSFSGWFLGHSYEFGPRDFVIILTSLLQLLLIGFTIYQYLPSAPKDVYEAIGFWYLLVSVLNSSVAILWFFHLDLFAFVGLLWQLATLVFVYHRLRDYPPRNGTDHAFVNAPFSIYTAYSFFIVLWQIFQFSNETKHNQIVHTFIIVVIGFISLHLVDYSHRKDWVYALTTAWILLGAAVFLVDTPHIVSLIVVGILVSAVARTLIPNWLDRFNRRFSTWANRLGERTPLLH